MKGDNIVTASFVVVSIRGLIVWGELYAKYQSKFVATLGESLDKRMSRFESLPAFTLAAALDL